MKLEQAEQSAVSMSADKLLTFVSEMMGYGGRPDDEHPSPPGPWDPVIRTALDKIREVFGPHPEPWRTGSTLDSWRLGPQPEPWRMGPLPDPWLILLAERHPEIWEVIGGGPRTSRGEQVGLNPQPLPPRYAFLSAVVRALVGRAELMQEIAGFTERAGTQQGIIVVGGYVSKFADDWCGNGFKLRWPHPGPHPHWFPSELNGMDLVVMASQFQRTAKETFSPDLRNSLHSASKTFAEKGLALHDVRQVDRAA